MAKPKSKAPKAPKTQHPIIGAQNVRNSFLKAASAMPGQNTTTIPWWSYTESMLPSAVFSAVRTNKTKWGLNYIDMVQDGLRYADREYSSFFTQSPYIQTVPNQCLSLNVTAACIDTLLSKIAKHIPTVSYLTSGGDFLLQQEADKLSKFINGWFQYKSIFQKLPQFLKDMIVYGTTLDHVRMHQRKKELVYEQVKPYEFIFDWNCGVNETVTDFHIVRFISKFDLIMEFPQYAREIMEAPIQNDLLTTAAYNTDAIICIFSYSFYAERYAINIPNKTLHDQHWFLKDRFGDSLFPLAVGRYEHGDRNFFGVGGSSKLKGIQRELNTLVRTAQRASHLGSIPKILCPTSANVAKSAFDNNLDGIGIITFSGVTPPTSMPMITIPTDLFTQTDRFYARAYEIFGINQLSAGGKSPLGPDASGKAIETMYTIESDRFQMVGQEYENFVIQLHEITLAFYEQEPEMAEKALVTTYYDQDKSETLKFKDINITRDMCYLKAFPISQLPQTPAGQFEEVYKRLQAGIIDMTFARKLLRTPDTETFDNFENAEFDFVMEAISKMVRGEPQEPIDIQNLDFALVLAQKAYFFYSTENLTEVNLEHIADYINKCKNLLKAQFEEAQKDAIRQQQFIAANQPQHLGASPGSESGQPESAPEGAGGGAPAQAEGGQVNF